MACCHHTARLTIADAETEEVVMWILEAQSLGSADERSYRVQSLKHYLTAGTHLVGRNLAAGQSSIVVEEDKSISRGHATITVAYAQARFKIKGRHKRGRCVLAVVLSRV